MKLTKNEKNILTEIFKASNGLFLFSLYRQLNLSPKEIFIAVEKLKENKLIDISGDRVTITKEGVGYAVQNPLKIREEKTFTKKIDEDFIGRRIDINEFYIPQNFEN